HFRAHSNRLGCFAAAAYPPAGRGRNQLAGAALAHEEVADCAHRAARATARGVRQAPRDAGEVRGVAPHLARYRAHRAQRTNQCTLRGACAPPRARHSTIMAQREALKLLEDRLWQAGQSIVSGIDTGDALLQASHAAELAEQEGWNKVIGIDYSTKQKRDLIYRHLANLRETHNAEQTVPWVVGKVVVGAHVTETVSPDFNEGQDTIRFEAVRAGDSALRVRLWEALEPGSSTFTLSDIEVLVAARRVRVPDVELVEARQGSRRAEHSTRRFV
ncbi:hypothetical protein T492DRAFT_1014802, partial [Pavlovales sp. CCMP2436]